MSSENKDTTSPAAGAAARGSLYRPGSASLVYQRDHSFYAYSHGGSAGRYHYMGDDLASACGRARLLDDHNPSEATNIPEVLRCKARGCREKWPNAPHERRENRRGD